MIEKTNSVFKNCFRQRKTKENAGLTIPVKSWMFSFRFLLTIASSLPERRLQKALENGLFAFSCTKAAIFDDCLLEMETAEQSDFIRRVLRSACKKAEEEERLLWREEQHMTFERLNQLLMKHGYQPDTSRFQYPGGNRFEAEKAKQLYDLQRIRLWIE